MNEISVGGASGSVPESPVGSRRLPPPPSRPFYYGQAGSLAKIAITNALLTICTLGIYRFWGKTRIRRYFWSHVGFLGDRLEYSGTGKELFLGFLVAIVILAPVFFGFYYMEIWAGVDGAAAGLVGFGELVIIFFLVQLAIFRARRYRLARTQWRGIRCGQSGSTFRYAFLALGWAAVVVITLGLAYPVYRVRLQRYLLENTWFGDRHFSFDGRAGDLFGRWFVTWLLFIFTFGLIYFWYQAREISYLASRTRYGAMEFRSNISAMALFLIHSFYYLAAFFAVGLFAGLAVYALPALFGAYQNLKIAGFEELFAEGPFVSLMLLALIGALATTFNAIRVLFFLHPMFRLVIHSLSTLGQEDFAAIAQSQQATPGRGEGLADTLDVGAF
jgi:uncharacterized membrane protein YjgN (DUF898 family)